MKRRLTFRRGVADDIAEGVSFYESQSPGLGRRFRNEVALMLRRMESHPLAYPKAAGFEVHKAAMKVFPYCIYYQVDQSRIAVVAVHDARRDPSRWEQRI